MARWRLTAKHYLPVPGTEWEQKETDRDTGRTLRKVYPVPRYIDPDDPADWTDRSQQIVIVTNVENSSNPRDIYFTGEPTPDMEPVDDEAEAISAKLRQKWDHPIESLPANGGMNPQEQAFMQTMMAAFSQQAVAVPPVEDKRIAELQEQMAALLKSNAELQAKLADTPQARRA